MTSRTKWLRAGNAWFTAIGAVFTVIGALGTLYGAGLLQAPSWPVARVLGPYAAVLGVAGLVYLALLGHVDRRAAELRAEILKAQTDADTALFVLKRPRGLRALLEQSVAPSGCIVEVEKDFDRREAYDAAKRLGIVRNEEIEKGHVYWVWHFGDVKLLSPETALLLASDVLDPPY